jgi:PiT family inorganic phosphate transporter
MNGVALVVLVVGAALAFANGANDVSKGIATLVGSGVTDTRRAITWGAAWTAIGGLLGALFAGAMLATFGNAFLQAGATPTAAAAVAVLVGAAAWVFVATRTGLPVSTTHALVGSLVGVMALALGVDAVSWKELGGKVALPLIAAPIVSLFVTGAFLHLSRRRSPKSAPRVDCLCAEVTPAVSAALALASPTLSTASLTMSAPQLRISAGPANACAVHHPAALRVTVDHLHWLTSGATSLARGMNDAPKIVALVAAALVLSGGTHLSMGLLFTVVTVAMVAGSLVAGRRVTRVLAENVTAMDQHEGFTANLVTAGLVTAGAVYGLPMSTTHVSSGAIVSAGFLRGTLDKKTLRDILFAWVVTLPAAAALGMSAYGVAKALA